MNNQKEKKKKRNEGGCNIRNGGVTSGGKKGRIKEGYIYILYYIHTRIYIYIILKNEQSQCLP